MTWLYFLNYFILQWFFIRLAKIQDNGCLLGYHYKNKYKILKWIIPLTGWKNNYKFLNKDNG